MIEKTAENLNKLKSKYKNFYLISNTVFSQDTEDSIRETLNYIKKIYLLIKIKQHTLEYTKRYQKFKSKFRKIFSITKRIRFNKQSQETSYVKCY